LFASKSSLARTSVSGLSLARAKTFGEMARQACFCFEEEEKNEK